MKTKKKLTPTKYIWLNGKLIEWGSTETYFHLTSYTLHYGIGVFEGIRYYETKKGPAIFRLKEHVNRLFESAKIGYLEIPFSQKEIFDACIEVVKINGLAEGYIRPLVFIGQSKMGLGHLNEDVQVAIITWPWGTYLGKEILEHGARLKTSSYTKYRNMMSTKAKAVGNYEFSNRVKIEAQKQGYTEGLILDENGYVTECSAENIFMVKDGAVITPPVGAPILLGITRDTIITIARDQSIPVTERNFTRDELYSADEVFLTGTAVEVTPVCEIDDRTIGNGKPGPITQKLQKLYFSIVKGSAGVYKDWLTYIN